MSKNDDTYEHITKTILESLREGVAPWRRTWSSAELGLGRHRSVHGHYYRGINALITAFTAASKGYGSAQWVTFRQAKKLGGSVRRGEKGTTVVLWKPIRKRVEDEAGEETERTILLARTYTVFNVEQCDGLEKVDAAPAQEREHSPIEACESLVASYAERGPELNWGGGRAFYAPSEDRVQMPKARSFESDEAYYATLFHELVHSTGHEGRLARDGVTDPRFGSHAYSKEELVAEIGAAMLCGLAGIENTTIHNQAAYCQAWLERLEDDPKLIVHAAQHAQKAADWIAEG